MSSSTTVASSPTTTNSSAAAPTTSATWSTMSPVVDDSLFLQNKLAQGVAGVFVWAALFLTCQQVYAFLHIVLASNTFFILNSNWASSYNEYITASLHLAVTLLYDLA